MTIGFIGLGLIGGSIARAIRKFHKDHTLIAFDPDGNVTSKALSDGVIDRVALGIDDGFEACDMVFLCAPVTENEANLALITKNIPDTCILTDVGSVKGNIHRKLNEIGYKGIFIGGHPMAGSEKFGYENSSARVIDDAYFILTPGENVPKEAIDRYAGLIRSIGAKPVVLSVDEHDLSTGVISHIPHIISSSLVHFLMDHDNDRQLMRTLAAGGFKDITRTASSSSKMWENICIANNDIIVSLLDDYIEEMKKVRKMLASKDKSSISSFFEEAKIYRDSLLKKDD